jgi:AcrR family transcriptional regulator
VPRHASGVKHVAPRLDSAQRNTPRGNILDSALRLFSDQGYTAVSIKEIAKAGGVNSALIYYYFDSKDHLFLEALKYSAHAASLRRQPSQSDADPVAEINHWFDANAKLSKPLGQMLRLMLDYRTTRKRSASVDRLIADFYAAEVELLRRAIDRGIKQGLFRPVDRVKTSLFVSTHLDGLTVATAIRPNYDLAAGLLQMRTILFDWLGYRGGAGTRRKGGTRAKLRVVE